MSKNTGGPAFARSAAWSPGAASASNSQDGMSLRDYFAAKAVQGFLANPNQDYAPLTATALKNVVDGAYALADAMLAAREAE